MITTLVGALVGDVDPEVRLAIGILNGGVPGGGPTIEEVSQPEAWPSHRRCNGVSTKTGRVSVGSDLESTKLALLDHGSGIVFDVDALQLDDNGVVRGSSLVIGNADNEGFRFVASEASGVLISDEFPCVVLGEEIELREPLIGARNSHGVDDAADED